MELILPKITKYRIQLKKPEDERPFGPNTAKRILTLVEKFEILYSVYQDELEPLFPNRIEKNNTNDPNLECKLSSEDEYEEKLQEMIEKCKLQTKMELDSFNTHVTTDIKIGKNLDKVIINEVQNSIMNEIKQADLSNKVMLLNYAIETLKSNNSNNAKNHIIELFDQIYHNPEALQLRVLRIGNELLQERILMHKGGATCLLAVGFQLKYGHQIIEVLENLMDPKLVVNEPYLYLDEPPIEEFDKWEQWRRHIKWSLETLKSASF